MTTLQDHVLLEKICANQNTNQKEKNTISDLAAIFGVDANACQIRITNLLNKNLIMKNTYLQYCSTLKIEKVIQEYFSPIPYYVEEFFNNGVRQLHLPDS